MKRRGNPKGDVQWFLHKKSKRPFTYSTVAEKGFIEVLCNVHSTIQEACDAFKDERWIHDAKVIEILTAYVEAGYGNENMKQFFNGHE